MSTPVDSLKVGDWVACSQFHYGPRHMRDCPYSGRPFLVKAIALPWVLARSKGLMASFDIRYVSLQRVSSQFAKVYLETLPDDETCPDPNAVEMTIPPKVAEIDRCVRCGERLIERLDKKRSVWNWYCPKCDREFGAVPK